MGDRITGRGRSRPCLTWRPAEGGGCDRTRVPSPRPLINHLWCQSGKRVSLGHLVGQMGSQLPPVHPWLPGH